MTIKEKLEFITASFNEVLKISPWIKLALLSVLGVLGGSGFITFLNKYAIYNYSVSYGGRLPVEGVPYIDVAVSVLSFAFLSISLISALLIYGLLTIIAGLLHKKIKNLPTTVIDYISGIFTSAITSVVPFLYEYLFIDNRSQISWVTFESTFYVLSAGIILGSLIVWRTLIRPFALLTTISLILLVSFKIFDAKNYASFLREIQYGGGIPVTLILIENNKEEKGNLFLTTETTNIIWIPKEKNFLEISANNVNEIKFHEDMPHELPAITGSLTRIFHHLWN